MDHDFIGLVKRFDELKANYDTQRLHFESNSHLQALIIDSLQKMIELQRKYIAKLEQ